MLAGTVIFVSITYLIMVATYFLHRFRRIHITVMTSIMLTDFFFPVYLYLTHDWVKRLIGHEEIFSFLIWMHFILLITLLGFGWVEKISAQPNWEVNSHQFEYSMTVTGKISFGGVNSTDENDLLAAFAYLLLH